MKIRFVTARSTFWIEIDSIWPLFKNIKTWALPFSRWRCLLRIKSDSQNCHCFLWNTSKWNFWWNSLFNQYGHSSQKFEINGYMNRQSLVSYSSILALEQNPWWNVDLERYTIIAAVHLEVETINPMEVKVFTPTPTMCKTITSQADLTSPCSAKLEGKGILIRGTAADPMELKLLQVKIGTIPLSFDSKCCRYILK